MKTAGLADVPVVVGGIIPPEDAQALQQAGVAAVYTPKDFDLNRIMADIVRIVDDVDPREVVFAGPAARNRCCADVATGLADAKAGSAAGGPPRSNISMSTLATYRPARSSHRSSRSPADPWPSRSTRA